MFNYNYYKIGGWNLKNYDVDEDLIVKVDVVVCPNTFLDINHSHDLNTKSITNTQYTRILEMI